MRVAHEISTGVFEPVQLPETYRHLPSFPKRDEATWNEYGYYRIEYEALGADQKQGQFSDGSLVGNVYMIPAINMTAEEIAARDEQELNSDVSQQAIDQRRADGVIGFDRIKAKIERKYRNGKITANQARNADAYFHPLIKDLNFGSWIIVQGLLNAEAPNVPAGYQSLFDTIKTKVDTYVQDNY